MANVIARSLIDLEELRLLVSYNDLGSFFPER